MSVAGSYRQGVDDQPKLPAVAPRARLCSENAHKLSELQASLPAWELTLLGSSDYPAEDGDSYEENARGKVQHGRAVGSRYEWMIGEDSGLECEALDGAPGLYSARWAAKGRLASALLEQLAGESNRRARMITVLVASAPSGEEIVVSGVLEGIIANEERGQGGFGYDPVFIPLGQQQTMAELGGDWKSRNSHRARAAAALAARCG